MNRRDIDWSIEPMRMISKMSDTDVLLDDEQHDACLDFKPQKNLTLEQRAKKLENDLLIKAIKLLIPVVRKDSKKAEKDGNTELQDELIDVTWWLLEKHDQLLIENGEDIS